MSDIISRFEAAARTLVGEGPVKQRLVRAYVENLQDLAEIKLPHEAGKTFRDLQGAFSTVAPAGTATTVQASVQKMSAGEATAHACTILDLYRLMVVAARRADHLKVVESLAETEDEPPQFLVGGT